MAGKRARMTPAALRHMAKVAREEGVAFLGRVDPFGNFTFKVAPFAQSKVDQDDDLDDRLMEFGQR